MAACKNAGIERKHMVLNAILYLEICDQKTFQPACTSISRLLILQSGLAVCSLNSAASDQNDWLMMCRLI